MPLHNSSPIQSSLVGAFVRNYRSLSICASRLYEKGSYQLPVPSSHTLPQPYVMKFAAQESQTKPLLSKNSPSPTFSPGPCLTCARRRALGTEARETNMRSASRSGPQLPAFLIATAQRIRPQICSPRAARRCGKRCLHLHHPPKVRISCSLPSGFVWGFPETM